MASDLRDALRRYAEAWRHLQADVEKAAPGLGLEEDVAADAERRRADYVAVTGATLLSVSDFVDASELAGMYFDLRPPFEPNGEKKAKFPDAIACSNSTVTVRGKGAKSWPSPATKGGRRSRRRPSA